MNPKAYGIHIAKAVAARSKDPKRKVGAVLFDNQGAIVSTGYNGFPPGFPDWKDLWDTDRKHLYVIHAEENALLRVDNRTRVSGSTMFVSAIPCLPCLVRMEAMNVHQVIAEAAMLEVQRNSNWYVTQKDEIEFFLKHSKIKRILI